MTPFKICLPLWKSMGVLCHVGVALEVNIAYVQISPPCYYVYYKVSFIWLLRFHVSLVSNLMVA